MFALALKRASSERFTGVEHRGQLKQTIRCEFLKAVQFTLLLLLIIQSITLILWSMLDPSIVLVVCFAKRSLVTIITYSENCKLKLKLKHV